ncbi:hypothetical protein ACOZEM_14670 [Streptomyces cellulosae]
MAHIGEVGGTLVDKLALLTPHAAHAWEGMRGEEEVLMPLVEQDAAEVLADLAAALRLTDLTWPRPDDEEVIALRALAWARCRDHLPDRPEHQPLAQGERARVLDAFEQVGAPCGGGSRHRPVAGRAVLGLRGELPQPRAAVLEPRPDRRLPGDWLPRKTVVDQAHRALLPAVFKRWVTFALTERGVPTPWIAPAVAAVSRHGPRHPPPMGGGSRQPPHSKSRQEEAVVEHGDSPRVLPRIARLVARSGDLKSELVAFAHTPRFARRLDARLEEAADQLGFLDEAMAVQTIDHFVLQHRLADGSSVLERFVAQRRPPLDEDERAMLLGWRDVVEAVFEVQGSHGDAVVLHNLLDDLDYQVHSNLGRRALGKLRTGMFVAGRIVPVHPDTNAWLVSGNLTTYPRGDGPQLAQLAVQTLTAHPQLLRRNPQMLRKAWEMQAEARADFIEVFGTDLLVLDAGEAPERMREYHRYRQDKALAGLDDETAAKAINPTPSLDGLSSLPEELRDADTVAVIFDETEGLCYYADFGHLDALFTDPALARDRTCLSRLRHYLNDDSVAPMVIRRLVQRHPDNADAVFRELLRKPTFAWERDGEELLRRRKAKHFANEPLPSITPVGARLAELLRKQGKKRR